MQKQLLLVGLTMLLAAAAVIAWLGLPDGSLAGPALLPQAETGEVVTPTLLGVSPAWGPNDLTTPITITGSSFSAVLSGTTPITAPTVYLGDIALGGVHWVSTQTLTASVPWGLSPQPYSLSVVNPEGGSATLAGAFTVTQGLGVWASGGPYGGRVEQILVHPDAPATAYALVFGVGAFATFDGGERWEPMVRLANPTRLALDAQNPDVIYCGGGGLQGDNLRSLDGGQTWTLYFNEFFPVNGSYRSYPEPHPAQAGAIYLATGGDERIPILPGEGGVYFSPDYGATWETRNTGLSDTNLVDLAFHPENPEVMAAAALNGKIFTSSDGGLHWTEAADLGRQLRRIDFNPYGSHEAWVVPHTEYQPPQPVTLFKSSSADLTAWDSLELSAELSNSGGIWTLAFRPGAIWAGGDWGYISDDGGATWDSVMGSSGEIGQIKTFAFAPDDDQIVYVGSEMKGVAKSTDGGAAWVEKNYGLAGLQVRSLAAAPAEIDTIYANTFERGLLRSDNGGLTWLELNVFRYGTPKGALLAVDPFTPGRVYLGDACNGLPCVKISEDRGQTWSESLMEIPSAWTGWIGEVVSLAAHPAVPGRILAGAGFCEQVSGCNTGEEPAGIYASDDYGQSWSYLGPDPAIREVRKFAFDAFDNSLIYAGTYGLGLWRSLDGGDHWQALDIPGVLPPVDIESVTAHPDRSQSVYVRLYSYASSPNPQPQVFASCDGGESWRELPDTDTVTGGSGGMGLVILPLAPEAGPYSLYSGCELGLCLTWEHPWSWTPLAGTPRLSTSYSLVAGSDAVRTRLYLGTPGGVIASDAGYAAAAEVPGLGQLLNGGVYRLTSLLPSERLYLALVSTGQSP